MANKVQSKLKAAVYGSDPRTFFARYDKDKGGTLDAREFKLCIRQALKVSPKDLPDRDIDLFVKALDDDGSGDLDIDELADFVERGTATFGSGPLDEEERTTLKWGERDEAGGREERERLKREAEARAAATERPRQRPSRTRGWKPSRRRRSASRTRSRWPRRPRRRRRCRRPPCSWRRRRGAGRP